MEPEFFSDMFIKNVKRSIYLSVVTQAATVVAGLGIVNLLIRKAFR